MTDNENNDNHNRILTSYNDVQIVEGNNCKSELDTNLMKIKVYKRRWFILSIYSLCCVINFLSYPQFSIITNIIIRYYGVSTTAVDWTMLIYLLVYIPLVIPAANLFEKIGLRWCMIVNMSTITLGTWIKVFSVSPDRFYVTFIGQFVTSLAMIFFASAHSRVAAQWFPSEQISTATSVGVFGSLLGVGIGFFIPPVIVKNHDDLDSIGKELQLLSFIYAGVTTVMSVFVIIFFKEEPKLPPSATRALYKVNRHERKEGFIEPMRRLFKNKHFLLLFNAHGLNVGVYNALATLLSQIYVSHFPNGEEEAGQIGLLIILAGTIATVCFGIVLDKTRKFKMVATTAYFLTILAQIIFAISLSIHIKWLTYAAAAFFGFSLSGYYTLGYELCIEYTYPESEFLSTGILIVSSNVYGIVLVMILSELMNMYGDIAAHIGFFLALLIGFVITILNKDVQRRENARKSALYKTVSTVQDEVKPNQNI